QAERMREQVAIPFGAAWKGADVLDNQLAEIDRQAEHRSKLDDDRVHLPVAVGEIDLAERLENSKVRGGADRNEFRQSLDDPQEHGQEMVRHEVASPGAAVFEEHSAVQERFREELKTFRTFFHRVPPAN